MKRYMISLLTVLAVFSATAQVMIPNTGAVDNSAALKVEKISSGSPVRGTLFPKLTKAQVYNIPNPATALIAFDSTDNVLRYYHPTMGWQMINTVPSFSSDPATSYEGQFIYQTTKKMPCLRDDTGWKTFQVTGNKLPN